MPELRYLDDASPFVPTYEIGATYEIGGCPCAMCVANRRRAGRSEDDATYRKRRAVAGTRATKLLLQYLVPEQAEDWQQRRAINVRGSGGHLFRLTPERRNTNAAVITDHPGRNGHVYAYGYGGHPTGIDVYPIGLDLAADWVLALKLYLEANELLVVESGCHDYGPRYATSALHDYGGAI